MNNTIDNTIAADARKALEVVKAIHARSKAEVAAGRFVWRGPSVCPKEGDGVSEKVPSDKALRNEEDLANLRLFTLLNDLVRQHTGFSGSFSDLVLAQESNGYRPTFREAGNEAIAVLADAYDICAAARGLEASYRPECVRNHEADRPERLTLQWIKDRLRDLRDISSVQKAGIDAKFFRSSGNEIRLGKTDGDYYEYFGGWDGTLKQLKEAAEHCRQNGGDSVYVGGHWLCGDSFDGDFEPTDCEWGLSLTVDDVLGAGIASTT